MAAAMAMAKWVFGGENYRLVICGNSAISANAAQGFVQILQFWGKHLTPKSPLQVGEGTSTPYFSTQVLGKSSGNG